MFFVISNEILALYQGVECSVQKCNETYLSSTPICLRSRKDTLSSCNASHLYYDVENTRENDARKDV